MTPTESQRQFVEEIAAEVNRRLSYWGRASGKTVARQMLVERILQDDEEA